MSYLSSCKFCQEVVAIFIGICKQEKRIRSQSLLQLHHVILIESQNVPRGSQLLTRMTWLFCAASKVVAEGIIHPSLMWRRARGRGCLEVRVRRWQKPEKLGESRSSTTGEEVWSLLVGFFLCQPREHIAVRVPMAVTRKAQSKGEWIGSGSPVISMWIQISTPVLSSCTNSGKWLNMLSSVKRRE